jgi:hypothetical protein
VTTPHLEIVRTAVLRDYPLRLWAESREHTDSLLREFQLLLVGEETGPEDHAPRRLVQLADFFTSRYGSLIDEINAERQEAFDRGADRCDSRVPMPKGTPELLDQVNAVMAAVDDYCRSGDLLVLPRSPRLLALADWTDRELRAQYEGAEPTPWPGPF